jgi:hypothetical protein
MKSERKKNFRLYAMIFVSLFAIAILISGVNALMNDEWETRVLGEGGVHGPGGVHGEGGIHGPGGVHGEGGVHG